VDRVHPQALVGAITQGCSWLAKSLFEDPENVNDFFVFTTIRGCDRFAKTIAEQYELEIPMYLSVVAWAIN